MNILVLTPDRVGSSLLQKFITMTMQRYDYGKPVINLHELTNGLEKYNSPIYHQEVLGKPEKQKWGYYQNLEEIVNLLDTTDHYKVSRLAQYHLLNRQDSLNDQLSFYKYINDNFFIISAQRENLFEHALSWCIVSFSKQLNVYSHEDKISTFKNLYKKRISVDQTVFENYLNKYLKYLEWVDNHFQINAVFNYEKNVHNLENYVNGLDIFPADQEIKTWQEHYGISWNEWNRCHYLISDMSGFSANTTSSTPLLESPVNTDIPLNSMDITQLMTRSSLSSNHQYFLQTNINKYADVYKDMLSMVVDRTLIDGVPIKLQTLAEKAMLIKNFKECVDTYNTWSSKNNLTHRITLDSLGAQAYEEIKTWYDFK